MPRLSFLRSSFYWKLAASHAAIAVAAALVMGLVLRQQLANDLSRDLGQTLRNVCTILGPHAREDLERGVESVEDEFRSIGEEAGIRLTWIARDGTVLLDTHEDATAMENHGNRPEVLEAYELEWGGAERESRTVGEEMHYVAKALRVDGEPVGVIRAAMSLDVIQAKVDRVTRIVAFGALGGALVAVLAGLYAARRTARPIREMMRTAQAISAGDYQARVRELPEDEVGQLGHAFNELAQALTRRLAESSQEQARLRAVLAGMIEGVIAVDDSDHVLHSNRAARELLGGDPGVRLEGRLWEHVRIPGLGDLINEASESGGLVRKELTILRDHGEAVIDAHAARFQGGGAQGVVLVLHDVSELRRLERVRRDFVANVSHELKTPLTSIQGYVETLLSGALRDEANNERFLRKIDTHVHRLVHLVSDLLSLARVESQEGRIPLVPVDLRQVVAQVVREHEPESLLRQQRVVFDRPDEPVLVSGDRDGLFQVVGNLLDNAIKYTPEEGTVELAVGRSGDRGWVEVRDTGIGIPPGELDRVFERFYRVDKARSREMGGTGLGLSIVKHLVGVMKGEIDVESAPGRGSTFRVELQSAEDEIPDRAGAS